MAKNLNEELYSRFGLVVDKNRVVGGFRSFLSNEGWKAVTPMLSPDYYQEPHAQLLRQARDAVLESLCRELFLDTSDYSSWTTYVIGKLFEEMFDNQNDSFETLLLKTQIFINILYRQKEVAEELDEFVEKLSLYATDFPILSITVKSYKTKASQILPSTSPQLDKEILDTLGVLDTDRYGSVLNEFEAGVKLLQKAKTDSGFKDVVEDMHASCDGVVKLALSDRQKGFKHAFDKETYKKLGLNGHQKEIFKNLKNWMDEIKHGSKINIERQEIEMIVSMTAAFVRSVAVFTNK